ncbi:hypothetical protein Ancab_021499, partial [Ancistrocladus abbreviatus]
SPRPISGIVPVMVDGQRFCVEVFEEASGETIFSKGFDRDRVPAYSMERQSDPDEISSNTFVPCSLEETRGGGKSTSLANITSSGELVFLNTPDSMDDRHGCRSPLGKSYCTEPMAIKIIKHFLVEPPLARYVSCSTDKDGGALMETQIGTIKRREEKATHFPFSIFQKPADNLTLELIGIGSGEGGPCVLKARRNLGESGLGQATEKEIKSPKEKGPAKRLELAKVKPRSSNVWRTKSSSKKRSLMPKGFGSRKKGRDSNTHGKVGEDVEISGMSIRDSNIENMNRLFLAKLNYVTVEEIWEVGKYLGVQSSEDDHVVVQRIQKLHS